MLMAEVTTGEPPPIHPKGNPNPILNTLTRRTLLPSRLKLASLKILPWCQGFPGNQGGTPKRHPGRRIPKYY